MSSLAEVEASWRADTDRPVLLMTPNRVSSEPSKGPLLLGFRFTVVPELVRMMRYWHPVVSFPMFGQTFQSAAGIGVEPAMVAPVRVMNPPTAARATMAAPMRRRTVVADLLTTTMPCLA